MKGVYDYSYLGPVETSLPLGMKDWKSQIVFIFSAKPLKAQ